MCNGLILQARMSNHFHSFLSMPILQLRFQWTSNLCEDYRKEMSQESKEIETFRYVKMIIVTLRFICTASVITKFCAKMREVAHCWSCSNWRRYWEGWRKGWKRWENICCNDSWRWGYRCSRYDSRLEKCSTVLGGWRGCTEQGCLWLREVLNIVAKKPR